MPASGPHPHCAPPPSGGVTGSMTRVPKLLSPLGRRGLTVFVLAALWLPSLDAVLHGALSAHQWLRHVESTDGCHAERCVLGMALAERALVADPATPAPVRQEATFSEVGLPLQAPLPVRIQTAGLPRSPPR